jgi:hypothetical protein
MVTETYLDFIYDPDQDPEEKRAVRKNYRSLAKTVEGVLCLSLDSVILILMSLLKCRATSQPQ